MSESPQKTHATSSPTNRLGREKSPYLLQHKNNPVDWYPWGQEAFARAKAENKPIFLSIGYSTCHWCHVMERESFEDREIAAFLNEHFVCVKVDREERPDVDKVYMTFVQATAGQGGWPLNVFITPDLKPFYGGTYFPPDSRHGRPGLPQVAGQIARLWAEKPGDLIASANDLNRKLANYSKKEAQKDPLLDPSLLRRAAHVFKDEYDARHGGFGGAPKFPRPSQPSFLLRHAVATGDKDALQMVLRTCDHMAAGGIHDQLGGGFARYSVDSEWLVPHFEKMLYDNAQLAQLYLDAFLVSGHEDYATVVRSILGYVQRDMTHPDGGFYSAEDADSEGKEGKFYCWTKRELAALLTPDEFRVATHYFGVTEHGNFVDHSDPDPLPHQNVLSIVSPVLSPADQTLLATAKAKMLAARGQRVRPHLDDKVLASWNGLMLGAFARSGAALGDKSFLDAARKNLAFIRAKLWDPASKTLYHRWRDGERDSVQLLEAYAFLLSGTFDLYEATLDPETLEFSVSLAETMIARFHDPEEGGFWQSEAHAADLVLRLKEDYDGAEPSGNSVAVLSLLRLGAICDRQDFISVAEKSLRLFAERLQQLPQAVPFMLQALDFWAHQPTRVVLAGSEPATNGAPLLAAVHRTYAPNRVILGTQGPVETFARTLPPVEGRITAYVCLGTACKPPTQDPVGLALLLKNPLRPRD